MVDTTTNGALPAPELPPDTAPTERPRRAAATKDKPAKDKPPRARRAPAARIDIAKGMTELYVLGGGGLYMVPTPPAAGGEGATIAQVVGAAVIEQADACGNAWANYAKSNARARRALERFLQLTAGGVLFGAHAPIILAAMVATGAMPPDLVQQLAGKLAAALTKPAEEPTG
jgi:hypothetical protein